MQLKKNKFQTETQKYLIHIGRMEGCVNGNSGSYKVPIRLLGNNFYNKHTSFCRSNDRTQNESSHRRTEGGGPIYDQFIPNLYPIYAQCLPNLCPIYTQFLSNLCPIYAQFIPNLCPMFTQFMPNLYPIFVQFMPNVCPIYTQFMPNVYPIYTQCMANLCPIYAQCLPNLFPMFTRFIPNLFPIYAQFMPNLKALSIFKFELDMLLFFIFIRGFSAKIPCIHFLLIKNNGEIFKNKHTFLVPHF